MLSSFYISIDSCETIGGFIVCHGEFFMSTFSIVGMGNLRKGNTSSSPLSTGYANELFHTHSQGGYFLYKCHFIEDKCVWSFASLHT